MKLRFLLIPLVIVTALSACAPITQKVTVTAGTQKTVALGTQDYPVQKATDSYGFVMYDGETENSGNTMPFTELAFASAQPEKASYAINTPNELMNPVSMISGKFVTIYFGDGHYEVYDLRHNYDPTFDGHGIQFHGFLLPWQTEKDYTFTLEASGNGPIAYLYIKR